MTQRPSPATAGSQTLDRGLRALEALAEHGDPISISELADRLGVHRSNAYRILRTLEDHRFVLRDEAGLIRIGPRLAAIARGAAPNLHAAATPELTLLAERLGMTAFVSVLDADVAITLLSVEPSRGHASVAQRPGAQHSVAQGAPGHAIEAILTPAEHRAAFGGAEPSAAAQRTAELGYSVSTDEVIPGITSVAVPLRIAGEPPAALAVVRIGMPEDVDAIVAELRGAAERISQNYR